MARTSTGTSRKKSKKSPAPPPDKSKWLVSKTYTNSNINIIEASEADAVVEKQPLPESTFIPKEQLVIVEDKP